MAKLFVIPKWVGEAFEVIKIKALDHYKLGYNRSNTIDIWSSNPFTQTIHPTHHAASVKVGYKGLPFSHFAYIELLNTLLSGSIGDLQAECNRLYAIGVKYFKLAGNSSKPLEVVSVQWAQGRAKAELNYKLRQLFKLEVFSYGIGNNQKHGAANAEATAKGKYNVLTLTQKAYGEYERAMLQVPVTNHRIAPSRQSN